MGTLRTVYECLEIYFRLWSSNQSEHVTRLTPEGITVYFVWNLICDYMIVIRYYSGSYRLLWSVPQII